MGRIHIQYGYTTTGTIQVEIKNNKNGNKQELKSVQLLIKDVINKLIVY